jgi:hypothetical protein
LDGEMVRGNGELVVVDVRVAVSGPGSVLVGVLGGGLDVGLNGGRHESTHAFIGGG